MGLEGLVGDGLDERVKVDVFVCMRDGMWWRDMCVNGRIDINTFKFCSVN